MPNRTILIALALTLAGCSAFDPDFGSLQAAPSDGGASVVFARDIRPLMDRSATDPSGHGCKRCHYATEMLHTGIDLGGLDLTTLGSLRRGGATSGARVVVPGNADASALYLKLEGTYPFGARMPKDGPPYWSDDEIALVERWIDEGARGDDSE